MNLNFLRTETKGYRIHGVREEYMYVACTQFQCEKRDVCRGYVALFISLVISCYLALLRFMFACVTFIHLCEFVWGLTSDRFSASASVSCSSSFHI